MGAAQFHLFLGKSEIITRSMQQQRELLSIISAQVRRRELHFESTIIYTHPKFTLSLYDYSRSRKIY